MQYCVAKYGSEPNELHLEEDATFKAIYYHSGRGEHYEEEEFFYESCLTADLDAVYEERKKNEQQQREKQQKENAEREKLRKEIDKIERKRKYEELKKEFE